MKPNCNRGKDPSADGERKRRDVLNAQIFLFLLVPRLTSPTQGLSDVQGHVSTHRHFPQVKEFDLGSSPCRLAVVSLLAGGRVVYLSHFSTARDELETLLVFFECVRRLFGGECSRGIGGLGGRDRAGIRRGLGDIKSGISHHYFVIDVIDFLKNGRAFVSYLILLKSKKKRFRSRDVHRSSPTDNVTFFELRMSDS